MIEQKKTQDGWVVQVQHLEIPEAISFIKVPALEAALNNIVYSNGLAEVRVFSLPSMEEVKLPSKEKLSGDYEVHYEGIEYLHTFK